MEESTRRGGKQSFCQTVFFTPTKKNFFSAQQQKMLLTKENSLRIQIIRIILNPELNINRP